jgi:hypothetical protein
MRVRLKPWQWFAMAGTFAMHVALFSFIQFGSGAVDAAPIDADPMPGVITITLDTAKRMMALPEPKHARPAPKPATAVPKQADAENAATIRASAKPYYFEPTELTQKPLVSRDIPPDLVFDLPDAPPQAAVLRLLINEMGEIDKVIIEESSVPEHVANEIIAAFQNTRFHPGEKDGRRVKSQVKIEIMLESTAQ